MPFEKQQRNSTRYFVYNNLRYDGNKIIGADKPTAVLAPYKAGVPAPKTPVFTDLSSDYSGGYPNLTGEDTAGNWNMVDNYRRLPDPQIINRCILNTNNTPSAVSGSRNGLSKPFSAVVQFDTFKNRYYLTTESVSSRRSNQITPDGRWVYARPIRFCRYVTDFATTDYSYNIVLSTTNAITTSGRAIATWGQNFIASDASQYVNYRQVNGSVYSFGISGEGGFPALSSSIVAPNTALNQRLYPFDIVTKNNNSNINFPGSNYGYQVGLTRRNLVVSYPLSSQIFVYTRNEKRPFNGIFELTNSKVLTASFNNAGTSLAYVSRNNRYRRDEIEYLAVGSESAANNKVQIWTNQIVTRVRNTNMGELSANKVLLQNTNTSLSSFSFQNRWSVKPSIITNSRAVSGSFGSKLAFITPDLKYNRLSDFLVVSEPHTNNGFIHLYKKDENSNQFKYVTNITTNIGKNFGTSIATAGPYLAVSAPRSILQGVSGTLIEIYRIETRKKRKPVPFVCTGNVRTLFNTRYWCGVEPINGSTAPVLSSSQTVYKIVDVDTIFIPNSGTEKIGYDITFSNNYDTLSLHDNMYRHYYGDHLVITGDTKSYVYSKCDDKFEFLCHIPGAATSRIWDNNIYQINNYNNTIIASLANKL
jgi:hypothetical protein